MFEGSGEGRKKSAHGSKGAVPTERQSRAGSAQEAVGQEEVWRAVFV